MYEQSRIYQSIKDGKLDTALKDLFENIEENLAIVENCINAGIVLSDVGEIEKAERFFQKALTIESENGAVYHNLINTYYNEECYSKAIKLYQTALQYEVTKKGCNYMVDMSFSQLGASKEALPFLMAAAEMGDDRDLEVQSQYGLVLRQLEMSGEAIKQLNKILSIDSQHVDGIYNLGLATCMKNENLDEAIAYFEQAISIDEKYLLSQHALKTFKTVKEEE